MALARLHIWNPGDLLKSADLNGEFNNILNNATALISPLTGPVSITNASTVSGAANPFLNLAWTGHSTLKVYPQTSTNLSSTGADIFTFDGGASGLQMHLLELPGGQRVWIWDAASTSPPVVHPHTGGLPAFAVEGDITVGDIVTFSPAANAWIVGERTATGLTMAAITHIMSASKNAGNDTDGGADIDLYPTDNAAGVTNDGIVELHAYGRGSNTLANSVILANRSAANTVLRRWQMGGPGNDGTLFPFANATYDLGKTANAIKLAYINGVAFPATQVASTGANVLDDYEEGTWVPTLTFATPGNINVVYTIREGSYTKVGRMVTLHFFIITSTFTHTTAAGVCTISGLPFTADATMTAWFNAMEFSGITKANYTQVTGGIAASTATITLEASGSAQALATVTTTDMPTGGTVRLAGTITYSTA